MMREVLEIAVAERGRDEEDSVGTMGAGFDDLVLVDDEVLAEAGNFGCGRGDFEVLKAALEEGLVGEDREGCSAGVFEVRGEGLGIEVGADDAF